MIVAPVTSRPIMRARWPLDRARLSLVGEPIQRIVSCFGNYQSPPLEIPFVEHRDGLGSILARSHLDKGKPPGATCSPILQDTNGKHWADLSEIILQIGLRRREG